VGALTGRGEDIKSSNKIHIIGLYNSEQLINNYLLKDDFISLL
jgi:hypothetical protein